MCATLEELGLNRCSTGDDVSLTEALVTGEELDRANSICRLNRSRNLHRFTSEVGRVFTVLLAVHRDRGLDRGRCLRLSKLDRGEDLDALAALAVSADRDEATLHALGEAVHFVACLSGEGCTRNRVLFDDPVTLLVHVFHAGLGGIAGVVHHELVHAGLADVVVVHAAHTTLGRCPAALVGIVFELDNTEEGVGTAEDWTGVWCGCVVLALETRSAWLVCREPTLRPGHLEAWL